MSDGGGRVDQVAKKPTSLLITAQQIARFEVVIVAADNKAL
jgi:hypothetical protein